MPSRSILGPDRYRQHPLDSARAPAMAGPQQALPVADPAADRLAGLHWVPLDSSDTTARSRPAAIEPTRRSAVGAPSGSYSKITSASRSKAWMRLASS